MANWQRTLRLNPEWDRAKEKELSMSELAGVIAKRLAALRPFQDKTIDDERAEIVEDFELLSQDASTSPDDLDDAMGRLYDWADQRLDGEWPGKKVCWVDAHSSVSA